MLKTLLVFAIFLVCLTSAKSSVKYTPDWPSLDSRYLLSLPNLTSFYFKNECSIGNKIRLTHNN